MAPRRWVTSCLGVGTVALATVLAGAARPVAAQAPAERGEVAGRVVDAGGRAVSGARVSVLGTTRLAESDDLGAFRLTDIATGEVRLAVRRLGFAPETLTVLVRTAGAASVSLSLERVSQPLPAVQVHGRRDLTGPMAGFYERMERGHGRFFTQEQLDKQTSRRMSDLLRGIPGLRLEQRRGGAQSVRMRGSTVAPLFWLDGVPMGMAELDLDNFDPRTFAGIEIYSGAATVPVEFAGGRTMTTSGGTVLLWTRQGEPRARSRKKDGPSPMSVLLQMLDESRVFTRDSVDTPATLIGGSQGMPLYPDSLYAARVGGRVEVEFVVDAEGAPLMDTFGVVASSHPAFVDAVRRVIEDRRYVPATRRGRAVAQLVQVPYEFLPDTGAGTRRP